MYSLIIILKMYHLIFLFLVVIPFATSLSFNFSKFDPNDHDIVYERSAYAINNVIQLTQQELSPTIRNSSFGRATYAQPLYLWDMVSRNLSDFYTNFSFSMNGLNGTVFGDGLAFFLAPNGSMFKNSTNGGNFPLTTDVSPTNSTDKPFLAVEFDIFQSNWDVPDYEHVGIDLNTVRTADNYVEWQVGDSIREGFMHEVFISYGSKSKNLTVTLKRFDEKDHPIISNLSYVVDLSSHLPQFVTFGFAAASGDSSTLHTIHSWSFSSTLDLNVNVTTDSSEVTTQNFNSGKGYNNNLLIGLAIGDTIFVLVMGLAMYCFCKKRKRMVNGVGGTIVRVPFSDEFEQGSGPKQFAYKDLQQATNNFAEENKLGEGGFGGVYKGFLKGINLFTAVKRISSGSKQGIKEYASEVKIISRLRHRNLVQLLGWCHEKNELLLVYEFLSHGSLDLHLFKGKSLLSWGMRYKIAQGLAAALLYLHEEWDQCVVHRDSKSSNIMLDANFNAKLGDFGLARLVDHEKESHTTMLAGTLGYMAPECAITGKTSKETDVFSFGVVALEIASGRRPLHLNAKQARPNLIEWIWSLYGTENLLDAADPRLGNEFSSRELEQLLIVGLWCVHPNSDSRPSIRQAVLVLNFEAPLPILPLKKPVPRYYTSESDRMLPKGTSSEFVLSGITESSSNCTVSGTSSSSVM